MNIDRLPRRLRFLSFAVIAFLVCLCLTGRAQAEQAGTNICNNAESHSVEYQNKSIYCASTPEEKTNILNKIDIFAKDRNLPLSALQLEPDEAQVEDTIKDRNIYYIRDPFSDSEISQAESLITVRAQTFTNAEEVLSNLQEAVQTYRRQSFGCELTNQIVSIGTAETNEPFLCVHSGLLGEDFTDRAERIQQKIEQVAKGNINIETLEIVPLSSLRTSMGISRYEALEGDKDDIDKQAMAIVSKSPRLMRQDKIILIVTALDAALYRQVMERPPTPHELANTHLRNLIRISRYAYRKNARPVTFNMMPFFWVRSPMPILYPSSQGICQIDQSDQQAKAFKLFPILPAKEGYYNASFRADEISKNIEEFANSFNPFPFIPSTVPLENLKISAPDSQAGNQPLELEDYLNYQIFYTKNNRQNSFPTTAETDREESEAERILIMTIRQEDIECFQGVGNTDQAEGTPPEVIQNKIRNVVKVYRTAYRNVVALIVLMLFILSLTLVVMLRAWRAIPSERYKTAIIIACIGMFATTIVASIFTPLVWRSDYIRAAREPYQSLHEYFFSDFPALMSIVMSGLLIYWILPLILVFGFSRFQTVGLSKQKASVTLLRFGIFVITCVLASPHFPGAGTVYLAGISGFVALAFSLSAGAAVGDIIAGIVLIYFSQINEGSWIQIGEIQGEVITQNLFVHRIRTSKNEILIIPNVKVLNDKITDYSRSSANTQDPLLLHTTITLGYDIPWQQVHQLLTEAAIAVNQDPIWAGQSSPIREDKAPFVLQLSLDDFYVTYQLNAYTNRPGRLSLIYSKLHENIQSKLHGAGIEILSPHYAADRDPSHPILPPRVVESESST
ncbi:MAG: mechanosensitive ion channel family protein [Phormidesmis sp.]